jgi:hypothetical protein
MAKLATYLKPRSAWPLPRKLAWFACYVAVCYWSWFLIIPHQ